MQGVSENWKNAHRKTLLNESYVEVSLSVTDPDALAGARALGEDAVADNGAAYISTSPQIISEVDKEVVPYCTLEQNLWLLDNGRKSIPESNYGNSGYIGDVLSDDVCVFSDKMPVITIRFDKTYHKHIPGVTITWGSAYDEFAVDFIVSAYNGTELIAEKEIVDNRSVTSSVWLDIVGYDRIIIQVKTWCLPHHRARIEEVFVGIYKVYSKRDLFDFSHKQSVDIVSTSLPKSDVKFTIDNVSGEYNPLNPDGITKYLMERQEVNVRYGLKQPDKTIEWIKGGTFYLSEWYAKQNGITADFSARDILEFMSDIYYDTVTEITDRKLYDLAESILRSADLPLNDDGTVKWVIDESLKSITTRAPLTEDTHANCLQLIANAGRCVFYQDRGGTLHIEPLSHVSTDYEINSHNSYSRPEVTLGKPIKMVTAKVYEYKIVDGVVESDSYEVERGSDTVGETIVIDNPLITSEEAAEALCAWIEPLLENRATLDFSWRPDVRLDALDIITSENAYNTNRVRMTDVEYRYNGAFRATGKGRVMVDG